MTMRTTSSSDRLEVRIRPDLHAILKRAANLQGRSVTDFVIAAVHAAAVEAIEKAEIIHLSMEDQKLFAENLFAPSSPNLALQRALEQHEAVIHDKAL